MSHEQLFVVQYDPGPHDYDSDYDGAVTAIGARLDLATGELDAVRLLVDRAVYKDYRVHVDHWFAGAVEDLIKAGRNAGATILASHGMAGMFPTLASALTPTDPRWVCTYRLAAHLGPDAIHPDIDVLIPSLGLDRPPADPDFRQCGLHAASAAVLLGRVCRAVAAGGHDVTPTLLRDWSEADPQALLADRL